MAKKLKKSTSTKRSATTPPKIREEGADFVGYLQLRFIRMVESSSQMILKGDKLPIQLTIKTNAGHATREEGNTNVIGIHLTVEVIGLPLQSTERDEDASHLSIISHFETQYETELQPTEDELKMVVGIGMLAGWPNVREFVLSTSTRMGLPPIILPMAFMNPKTGLITMHGGVNSEQIPQ